MIYKHNGSIITDIDGKWLSYTPPPPPPLDEVTIGTQTWKSLNLAVDDGQGGIIIVDDVYANNVDFGTQYYYTWDAAVRIANSIEGWHLPSIAEWETLATYVGGTSVAGTKLKSTMGWTLDRNGTDDYGFTALPVGAMLSSTMNMNWGNMAYFWTNHAVNEVYKDYRGFEYNTSNMVGDSHNGSIACSVRLIKDT